MSVRRLRLEWRLLRRDTAVWIAAAGLAACLIGALTSGASWRTFVVDAQSAAVRDEVERYDVLAARIDSYQITGRGADPRQAATVGGRAGSRYALLPVRPLAILSAGQSDLLPGTMRVSTEAREQVLAAAEIENPHRLLDGRFDVAFVIVYLYPLFILAVSFNVLAAERERGTVALLGAQPTPLSSIVAERVGLRLVIVIGVTVGTALAGVIAAGVSFDGDTWARAGLWTLATAIYGAFWFAVAMAIAARGTAGATAALTAGGVWLVLVVVLPAVVNFATGVLHPMPSRVQMVQAMRAASDEASSRGSTLLAQYFESHPELLPDGGQHVADAAAIRAAVTDEVQRLVRPVAETFDAQAARQRAMADRLRFLSPALLLRGVLDDVSGTGAPRHAAFAEQVGTFHDAWREHFTALAIARRLVESLDAVPVFVFADETPRDVARRAWPALAVLIAVTAGLGRSFVHSMRRYSCAR